MLYRLIAKAYMLLSIILISFLAGTGIGWWISDQARQAENHFRRSSN